MAGEIGDPTASLLLAALLAATPIPAAPFESPVGPLPDGWVYLMSEVIDSFPGIYHDRLSGACVSMDVAWPSVVKPTPAEGNEVGASHGVRYHRSTRPSSLCPGGSEIWVSFFPASSGPEPLVWHFGTQLCSALQRERVQQFLFSQAVVGYARPRAGRRERLPSVAEVTGFKPGATLQQVVRVLGEPGDAQCEDKGGFTIGYPAAHGNSYREWDLRFDGQQRFISAKRRHPGY